MYVRACESRQEFPPFKRVGWLASAGIDAPIEQCGFVVFDSSGVARRAPRLRTRLLSMRIMALMCSTVAAFRAVHATAAHAATSAAATAAPEPSPNGGAATSACAAAPAAALAGTPPAAVPALPWRAPGALHWRATGGGRGRWDWRCRRSGWQRWWWNGVARAGRWSRRGAWAAAAAERRAQQR